MNAADVSTWRVSNPSNFVKLAEIVNALREYAEIDRELRREKIISRKEGFRASPWTYRDAGRTEWTLKFGNWTLNVLVLRADKPGAPIVPEDIIEARLNFWAEGYPE